MNYSCCDVQVAAAPVVGRVSVTVCLIVCLHNSGSERLKWMPP